MYRKDAFSTLI